MSARSTGADIIAFDSTGEFRDNRDEQDDQVAVGIVIPDYRPMQQAVGPIARQYVSGAATIAVGTCH